VTISREAKLQSYYLPDGVLPYAPRQPFSDLSTSAISSAVELVRRWPEKCGMLSHAIRAMDGKPLPPEPSRIFRLEAHFDAASIPGDLANRLVSLGFEPDGFARFIPEHYSGHFTLKFKIDMGDSCRRRFLQAEAVRRASQVMEGLAKLWPDIEAYLELEAYPDRFRYRWTDPQVRGAWLDYEPLEGCRMIVVVPPCEKAEAAVRSIPLEARKRADVHIKIGSQLGPAEKAELINRLVRAGFYHVKTWAGNDVCTAQFLNGQDAIRCFNRLHVHFSQFGGCSELTMEPVLRVWRSGDYDNGAKRLGALPPLVRAVV
jgi:hypothetical protein